MTSSEVPAPDRKKGRSRNRTGQDRTGYHDTHHGVLDRERDRVNTLKRRYVTWLLAGS